MSSCRETSLIEDVVWLNVVNKRRLTVGVRRTGDDVREFSVSGSSKGGHLGVNFTTLYQKARPFYTSKKKSTSIVKLFRPSVLNRCIATQKRVMADFK
jgi:hypothetical protein